MKIRRWYLAFPAALLFASSAAVTCGRESEPPTAPDSDRTPEAGAGGDLLRFSAEALARAGIAVAAATPGRREPEVEAFGRVLDPTALIGAIGDRDAARAAADAAARELERLAALAHDDQNASARDVEAARAAAAQAHATSATADARVVGLLGTAARERADLSALAGRIARRESAVVRVDAPAGGVRPAPERGARVTAYPDRGVALEADYLGPAADSDPTLPGWGFLFLVTRDPPPAGEPVHAWLRAPGAPQSGVRVPAESLVRHAGEMFVFVAGAPGEFERRAVTADALPDGSWFVSVGIAPGEQIVVSGAQALLSTEQLAAGGGERD
jgi:hypothetical protein